ncbi:MAG: septal ring lytic transglycosylase RlpA family protein [Woeseia sp.]
MSRPVPESLRNLCTVMQSFAASARQGIAGTLLLVLLSACASGPVDGPPRSAPDALPPDAVPRQEPRSRYGNGPVYEVFGHRYVVMDSSLGYRERGVASWYGQKFHGRPTSSQEPYDMHAMTAAHKTLPLPTYVRVRNLRNGKSVVVRVNDRGPFVDNRIIDLSYAAAQHLDMVQDGTSLVEVTALGYDEAESVQLRANKPDAPRETAEDRRIFVQVGAFGDVVNARRRYATLRDSGIGPTFVHEDTARSPALYRVRIGPIAGVTEYDSIVARLRRLGISETHLVTE